jgi:hypothetical protein
MRHTSFVETLEIARDERLRGIRPTVKSVHGDDPRRGPPRAPPEAMGETLRAAVNAGSIVSFVAGLSETEQSDVLFSTQLAQRAASAKHDRFAETEAWYRVYADVLGRLGWVGEAFAFTQRTSASSAFTIDRSALDVIMEIATSNQLAILVRTLDTLKGLAADDGTLQVFTLQALRELSGNFQIGAAQRGDNGAVSLAAGAFHFRTKDTRGRFLFITWGREEISFWAGATKLTLNAELYAHHRAAVSARLAADAADYIAAIDIV